MRILLNVSLILIALGWAWWLKGQLNINWWQGRYGRGDADFIQQHSRFLVRTEHLYHMLSNWEGFL